MTTCKRCHSEIVVNNGNVRGKQRYGCKECGNNFVEGDLPVKEDLVVKKVPAIILYALGKALFGMPAKIFGVSRCLTCRRISQEAARIPEPKVPGNITEMEFDEMWRFIGKKQNVDHQRLGSQHREKCRPGYR